MVDKSVITKSLAELLRSRAEDALTGPDVTMESIRLKQQQLANAGLFSPDWIDGEVSDVTIFAAQAEADPFFARSFLENMLITAEEWSPRDISKTQIALASVGVYDGEITGEMDQLSAHALMDYFPQSETISLGQINTPALSQIAAHAEDITMVRTMQMNPQLGYSRSSNLLDDVDPNVPRNFESQTRLIQAFSAVKGLTSIHNIDGISGPETSAAILAEFTDNDAIISRVLQNTDDLNYQDIRDMQRALSASGYNIGSADASMGPQTSAGLMSYLSNNPDQLAVISNSNLQQLLKHGDRDDLKTLMENSPEFLHKLEDDLVKLDEGSGHEDILSAQIRLQALGLYDRALDGVSGPGTRNAIAGFHENMQKYYELNPAEPGILSRKHAAEIIAVPESVVHIAELDDIPGVVRAAVFNPL